MKTYKKKVTETAHARIQLHSLEKENCTRFWETWKFPVPLVVLMVNI
jgi:hypothetical protein